MRACVLLVALGLAALGVSACWSTDGGGAPGEGGVGRLTLTGAGATFPYPIYSRWFGTFSDNNPVRVNYQSVGSGGGIRQMIEGVVDFGATDAPLTAEDLARMPGTLSIPMVIGSVAITYNLPGLDRPLRLDGPTVAAIFSGEVTRWRDPRLTALNPGTGLPDRDIIAVHRSDGSGTTYVFTDYLAGSAPPGGPRSAGATRSGGPPASARGATRGVTGQVRHIEGAIGYVEQVFAAQNDLPMARLENPAGEFVAPSVAAATAAAAGFEERIAANDDFRLSIVNSPSPGAYPVSSWTYLLVAPQIAECRRAEALADLVEWSLMEGAEAAEALSYAPLTLEIRVRALEALKAVTCGPERRPVIDPGEDFARYLPGPPPGS